MKTTTQSAASEAAPYAKQSSTLPEAQESRRQQPSSRKKTVHKRLKMTPTELMAYCVLKAISYHAVNGVAAKELHEETRKEHVLLNRKLALLQQALRHPTKALRAKMLFNEEVTNLWKLIERN